MRLMRLLSAVVPSIPYVHDSQVADVDQQEVSQSPVLDAVVPTELVGTQSDTLLLCQELGSPQVPILFSLLLLPQTHLTMVLSVSRYGIAVPHNTSHQGEGHTTWTKQMATLSGTMLSEN